MIVLRGKLVENKPLDVVRDAWREITRGAYEAVGRYWVATFLKGHFEPGAGQKYNYAFRTSAYRKRKDRAFASGRPMSRGQAPVIAGSNQPLVLTGYMRQELMRNVIVRGFPSRATVYLIGPDYLNAKLGAGFRSRNAGKGDFSRRQPDKQAEVVKVRGDEANELAKVLRSELLKRIDSYRQQKVTE